MSVSTKMKRYARQVFTLRTLLNGLVAHLVSRVGGEKICAEDLLKLLCLGLKLRGSRSAEDFLKITKLGRLLDESLLPLYTTTGCPYLVTTIAHSIQKENILEEQRTRWKVQEGKSGDNYITYPAYR